MRDAGHRTPDIGHRTSDGEKSKNNISTPQGGGHNNLGLGTVQNLDQLYVLVSFAHKTTCCDMTYTVL